ncbi:hypothetical protein [Natronorubrum thiooxidans]|uniref:Collagen triple helix repeat-containing protein n=1 Tax=Natronorubrum thiooxidans TaxID=308853 RepID=A0A1N7GHA1_9EURY|nr:hypothetical protein [Natronorubrum thiooxidans]SIS11974.1 hypothetical protein SAMN05421752_11261 [Natronorubrum thiooxidans]
MERRNVLLGSGAALATLLAGCSSEDTSDDDGSNDDGSDSPTNGDNDDTGDNGEDGEQGEKGEKGKDKKHDKHDDIPGFEKDNFELKGDYMSISVLKRKGDTVKLVVDSETTDQEKLYADLESLADDVDESIIDLETFADHIETIELIVKHDGEKVVSYSIDVQWIVWYRDGKKTRAQLLEAIKGTETKY